MITTLNGENSFGLQAALTKLIADFVAKHGDFGLERLSAEELSYQRLLEAIQASPFLADKRLVIIDNPVGNKELNEKIANVLPTVGEGTDLVFVQPKFDKRSSMYKILKKDTDFQEFSALDEVGLTRWAGQYVSQQGGKVAAGDLRYLIQRIGLDQLRLSHEVDKLLSYSSTINRQSIDLLTDSTPQSSVFQLLDAALAGQTRQALMLYHEQRQQKVEPQAILALLAWQLHVLAVAKTAGSTPAEQVARDSKLSPFAIRKAAQLGSRLSLTELKELVKRTQQLDVRLKRESIDADEALQNLLLSIV